MIIISRWQRIYLHNKENRVNATKLEYYTIFCGVFLYERKSETFEKNWQPWTVRLKTLTNSDNIYERITTRPI